MRLFKPRPRESTGRTKAGKSFRLLVAADIHGSDVCWRKFVNAASFYRVNALVLAGDITGKALVPVLREADDRFRVRLMGREQVVDAEELKEIERLIRFNGFYPYHCEPDELAAMRADDSAVTGAFGTAMRKQLEDWVNLADERLAGSGTRAFVMPGNDDPDFVGEVLDDATALENHDGRTVELDEYTIVGQGWSNITPWDTPREKPETDLATELDDLVANVPDPRSVILTPHVPPHDTGLDSAPELGDDLAMVSRGGQPNFVPVGSTGVREVIERFQPLISLSGHIHESKGVARIGDTVCVNPGSEYNVGRLLGALVELRGREVRNVQLVTG